MLRFEVNATAVRGGRLAAHDLEQLGKVMTRVLKLRGRHEISVALVGPATIRRLNVQYRGKDAVTDVLAFSLPQAETDGEVVLCVSRARAQARERKHSLRHELLFLLAHGALHVYGFDHERLTDRKRMQTAQVRILKSFRIDPSWD